MAAGVALTWGRKQQMYIDQLDVIDETKRDYQRVFSSFNRWVVSSGRDCNNLKMIDIVNWKNAMISDGKSIYTIDLYLGLIRRFFRFMSNSGWCEDIAANVRVKGKVYGYSKGFLSVDQIEGLMQVIDRSTLAGKRDYAMINLMWRTGVRCCEVCRMRVSDINIGEEKSVLMIRRKGKSAKVEMYVTKKVAFPIAEYFEARGVGMDDSAFACHHRRDDIPMTEVRLSKIVRRYLERSGNKTKKITAHSLRHTCAIQLLKAGAHIKDIQFQLGHARLSTTEIYVSALDEEMRRSDPVSSKLDYL